MSSRTFPIQSKYRLYGAQSIYQVDGRTNGVYAFVLHSLDIAESKTAGAFGRSQKNVDLFPRLLRVTR